MKTQQDQTEQRQITEGRPETGWAHYILEAFGISAFFMLALFMGMYIYRGMMAFGYSWLLPILAILAYLAADFFSGFVHFLADNFGSSETPIIGPNFVGAFREHHVDPKGITTHDFIDTNGNNSLASLPFMLLAWLFVPIETTMFRIPLRGVLPPALFRRVLDQPVPQVGAHRRAASGRGLAPAARLDPRPEAPRHPSRKPLRHLLTQVAPYPDKKYPPDLKAA